MKHQTLQQEGHREAKEKMTHQIVQIQILRQEGKGSYTMIVLGLKENQGEIMTAGVQLCELNDGKYHDVLDWTCHFVITETSEHHTP